MSSTGYFPGCSLCGTAVDYDASLRAVAAKLEIGLREVPDWLCCGATSAHALDRASALCLAADTLAKARKAGLDRVLAPCAMCYQRLATVVHEVEREPALGPRLASALGEPPDLGLERVRAVSLIGWLDAMPDEAITQRLKRPLKGMKVASYYGCLLVRPPAATGRSDFEKPRSMERVVRLLGGEPVRWPMATECCGASCGISRTEAVQRLTSRICGAARACGAQLVAVACPMCHANLDMRQDGAVTPNETLLPIVYLTQLMGLAFGVPEAALGFEGHFVPVEPALSALEDAKVVVGAVSADESSAVGAR